LGFHEALVAAAGSPRLLEIRRGLADQTARYRRLSLAIPDLGIFKANTTRLPKRHSRAMLGAPVSCWLLIFGCRRKS